MTRRTRANYEKAKSLRDSGLSLAEVGKRLGCSKQRIHKLLKSGKEASQSSTKASTTTSTSAVNRLTPRERKFARNLLDGQNQRQAALGAAPPDHHLTERSADTWAARKLKNEGFVQSFKNLLEAHGLGEADIARKHAQSLEATKVVGVATEGGRITDVIERPDFPTRQRAVSDAWRIHGRMKPDSNSEPPARQPIVVLSQEDYERMKVFTGGRDLPGGFEIAPKGISEAVLGEEGAGTVDARAEAVLPDEDGG